MNSIQIKLGRLGKDPERHGKLVTFSIADSSSFKNKEGEWEEKTQWLDVKCFGNNADKVEAGLKKGDAVVLSGRLVIEQWEDKDGKKRSKPVIIPDNYNGVMKVDVLRLSVTEEDDKSLNDKLPW
jgi:single-strand DNA-binding protein